MNCVDICSVEDLVARVKQDTKDWTHNGLLKPWFRGHKNIKHELIPSILRGKNARHEFTLAKKFRLMAPGYGPTPETDRLDLWLFLMQHHNAPTRLLDWTENVLVAAFFATEHAATPHSAERDAAICDAAIFAIDPAALNDAAGIAPIPVTWTQNPVLQTIKFAFGTQDEMVWKEGQVQWVPYLRVPVAIYPSTSHPRIAAQRGCFTLHGSDPRSFESIFENDPLITNERLRQYRIPKNKVTSLFEELSNMGISYASLFPDLDGLAKELRYAFRIEP
jgi:hypothetical protein